MVLVNAASINNPMSIGIIEQILIMAVETDSSFLKTVLEATNAAGSSTLEDCRSMQVQPKPPAEHSLKGIVVGACCICEWMKP